MKRGRSEESHIPKTYLDQLHNHHEEWITSWTKTPVLIIDNEKDNDWSNIMEQVNRFIKNVD